MRAKFLILLFSLLGLLVFPSPRAAQGKAAAVFVIPVADAISPGTAGFISSGIRKAVEEDAALIVIELNTPGGLADSMRDIVMAIYNSRVPVAVFVSPSGSRAASAGVMITMAADVAAMAPGTNIGAAHPVGAGGKEIDKTMADKVINDMVAYVKSIAQKRGRNPKWAEKAVRESISATETEALKAGVIDLVAKDLDDLIRKLDGRKIKGKGTLVLSDAQKVVVKENLRIKILKTISNPNVAYILMMIGLAGLYFELSHPGTIFPGVIGGICLILAFFAFQALPVNYAGILLILLAIIFFILEMKVASYGMLSVAGIVSLLLGSLMLFGEMESPEFRLAWEVLVPTLTVVSGFFVGVAALVFKSQVSRPKTGDRGIVGEIGVVKKDIDPEGKVFVHGELWNAVSITPIQKGVKVRVIGIQNLVLEVEPVDKV
ncbi:MAG: nodulation protein NfeD [Deltaproteobacteria bacterium]|nr:nodulation protein NfeD [Deltaproteobacteria bacterium]MBW2042817.1 nodulation protein NfeD [Deltaproteobacteria bacterium]MBW2133435.1 nodulation protein NfeD [Deltaproteobacteria bacterium]